MDWAAAIKSHTLAISLFIVVVTAATLSAARLICSQNDNFVFIMITRCFKAHLVSFFPGLPALVWPWESVSSLCAWAQFCELPDRVHAPPSCCSLGAWLGSASIVVPLRGVPEKYPTCVHISALVLFFVIRTVASFEVVPIWLNHTLPAVLPHLKAVLDRRFWNGLQLARPITLNRLDFVEPLSLERHF